MNDKPCFEHALKFPKVNECPWCEIERLKATIAEQAAEIDDLKSKNMRLTISRNAALSREKEAHRDWSTAAIKWVKDKARMNTLVDAVIEAASHEPWNYEGRKPIRAAIEALKLQREAE